jgi:uncharacterized membrane protein YdjX (TVP38/TMEM64 family)
VALDLANRFSIKAPGRGTWLLLALGAAVVVATLLAHSAAFKDFIDAANQWAQGVMHSYPVAGAAVFFLFSALSAMLAFASTAVLVPSAAVAWGKLTTFLLLWGGWIVGAIVAYGIGHLARPLVIRLGYKKKLAKYQHFISRKMKFWAVLLFCMAVPSEIPGYLFGSAHYSFVKFIAAIATAEAIYAAGLVIAGESLVTAEPLPLLIAIGVLVVIGVGASLALRSIRKRRAGRAAR